jgi:hypothetical protein
VAINVDQFQRDTGSVVDEIFSGCVLPVQYTPGPRGLRTWEKERRLLAAVLEDAIRCYLTNRGARTKAQLERFLEVQAWFNDRRSGLGPHGLFTFESICEALGIEPGLLRKRLSSIPVAKVRGRSQRYTGPQPGIIGQGRKRVAEAGR